jgi:predicted transcriptional regulator
MLICEDWKWQKMPVLKADEVDIIKLLKSKMDVKDISKELDIPAASIYRKINKLKNEGVITDDKVGRQTADSDAEDIC